MKGNREAGKILWKIVQAGIILLTLLAFIKAIFISLDIDESYAIAQSYRLACGDKLFAQMWESHQLSAFLSALFIKPYLMLFHTTDYLVIYLRVMGIVIHTGLGLWLYRKLKPEFGEKVTFLVLFLHLNFLPKWVQMPEFELMHYWFLLAVFLLLYSYFTDTKSKWQYPVLAGICLVGSMMSYPTMILLYPFYVLGLCILEKQKHGKKGRQILKSSLLFTAGAGVTGLGFLVYLFSYQSFEDLKRHISYIFLDESHAGTTMAQKWQTYAWEFRQHFVWYCKFALLVVVTAAVVLIVAAVIMRAKKRSVKSFLTMENAEQLFLTVLVLTVLEAQVSQILYCVFWNEGQFYLQIRYLAAMVPALYLSIRYYKKMSVLFYLSVLPALLSLPVVLTMTNMTLEVTYSRAFLGVLGSLLMLSIYCKEHKLSLHYFLGIGLLCGFFVCRLLLIRVTGCLPTTIMEPMEQLETGPAKGIYVQKEEAGIWNENYKILEELTDKEDRLLYIGAENLVYPAAGCVTATPSTLGTIVFNEMFLYYYEEYPDRLPNVVVIDKTFGVNPVYYYSSNNEIIFQWIEENYADAEVTETDYLKILRVQD